MEFSDIRIAAIKPYFNLEQGVFEIFLLINAITCKCFFVHYYFYFLIKILSDY